MVKFAPKIDKKIKVGTDLVRQLSTTFYPHVRMIFDEMISNALDAMSTVVKLDIQKDTITFEDNGEGMTREQLIKFFYIAHTEKKSGTIRTKNDVKRQIIGKFGIGKLSLYRLCKSFRVVTWRDEEVSEATFDFEEFSKKKFIEDFDLDVKESNEYYKNSGTKIILYGLNQEIDPKMIRRAITRTMPLPPDFTLKISGYNISGEIPLRSEDLWEGQKQEDFNIEPKYIEGVGELSARIIFLKGRPRTSAGIYVRVLGRIVNYDNPESVVKLSELRSAEQYQRRIIAEIKADCLDDILQTNRSGFIVENEKYKKFRSWVRKTINNCIGDAHKNFVEDRSKIISQKIPDMASDTIMSYFERPDVKAPQPKQGKTPKKIGKTRPTYEKTEKQDKEDLIARLRKMKIVVASTNPFDPEAFFDRRTNTIKINTLHPLYKISQSKGRLWGIAYHSVKASIVVMAAEMANNLNEFKEIYDNMSRESEQRLRDVTWAKLMKKKETIRTNYKN